LNGGNVAKKPSFLLFFEDGVGHTHPIDFSRQYVEINVIDFVGVGGDTGEERVISGLRERPA
jgi:hypothetical protein